jgi:hypothetical protein
MMLNLDKYARVARAWRDWEKINCVASQHLFFSGNPFLYFPAATLGHHALEMYLKAALICEGMTVFDANIVGKLHSSVGLKASDCVWGHNLAALATQLATRRTDFDLSDELNIPCVALKMPMKLLTAFELFDPFFSEIRYPTELKKFEGLTEEEGRVLDALVSRLLPFLNTV